MIITRNNYKEHQIGGKAQKLFQLMEQGYIVPFFFCVEGSEPEGEVTSYLEENFSGETEFSVRSSTSVEDGSQTSFAGQFQTYLHVPAKKVPEYVKKVMAYGKDKNLATYCKKQGIATEQIKMTVIVQEMIDAERSGVIFTANPQGILNETVIVVGNGTGDNVVEDRTETTTYYYNVTDELYYYENQENSVQLAEVEIQELITTTKAIQEHYGYPCDIEFAIKENVIYLLQMRPITTLKSEQETIVLDNSNIVESYPGITRPLTQSFIREVYYQVFKSLLLRLTGEKETVEQIDDILQHMVDVANGRVYYRISNWYDVILFLPFHKKIIPVWQEMLGVQNKAVSSHMENKIGACTRCHTTCSFFSLLVTNPQKMRQLEQYFKEVLAYVKTLDIGHADSKRCLEIYQDLKSRITSKWDITLANDMYSFLFTALLKARLKAKKVADYEIVTNRYISRIADIESMKPIEEMLVLARRAKAENKIGELESLKTNDEVWEYLRWESEAGAEKASVFSTDNLDVFAKEIFNYLEKYGDRNLEELKLESKTFRTDPILLIQRIVQYAKDDIKLPDRENLEVPKRGLTGWLAKKAALGIRNRETSRMNRSRLYGIMRQLMLKVGGNLFAAKRLECPEDIFWLFYEEIEQAVADESVQLMELVHSRKEEYERYDMLPAYSRLVFAGDVWNKTPSVVRENDHSRDSGVFKGVACSNGVVEGEVLIVDRPTMDMDTRDKILVTKMTDPGWVFLIADAKAIVAEKGSLLSHTAIISRELGKPAVVGVRHITRLLQNGDYVRVDGEKGEVTVCR